MSSVATPVVQDNSYLTLHYRIGAPDGADIVNTFEGTPATMQLGGGQMAPTLEQAMLGMTVGERRRVELAPEQAFGPRNPDLLQRVSMKTLQENSNFGEEYSVGDLVEFNAPSGGRYAGILRELGDGWALFDFNHPLAGQPIVFEVQIIGIL
ncbi:MULTISPECIES: FKBP-type peptidyl-prolyl cis-trans isomerase [Pandoraea]|uniref:Peptidyl-prolyl cis-trans isomerase n=3 Tax=Pandoraea TaxID=93217 RepID=A0A5E4UUN5_9BURK|nr:MULTISPECIES: peptidylprolyl isomerase [Pandoraea]AJC18245.1 peptidylprolyl isomerase [Pandoraea sputorum]MCE4062137.1 peptidylprolyl isomerase [Pandoraea sputorum]UVA78503.1 peptidylprolyl isomerase [Pandoraea commovens]SNU87834.1 FKBP-type 16 kDa peptidyl-prolyl cis-trans isomerase [Pandoraea sputorum]VVE03667.1 FKBP-type 16 kDa peptidyl-prolyl cis-trans isomerase [Pandoraea commovens]